MGIATLTKSAGLLSPELHTVTDEELQRIHSILLEMMDDIGAVCRENDIPWMLTGGSMLGAVRHKGFIPWDDDIDIAMLRKAFERFRAVFPGRFSDKYELKLPGDAGYLYQFPKVCRKNTTALTIQSAQDTNECISLDIFIMENVSDCKLVQLGHGLLCTALLFIVSVTRMRRCKYHLLKYGAASPELCAAVKKRALFSGVFAFLSLERWLKISDRVFALCKNEDSERIVIPSGNCHFFGERFRRDKMCDLKESEFEGKSFFIPEDAHYYLEMRYGGDYMKIPSDTEKERHAFIRLEFGNSI